MYDRVEHDRTETPPAACAPKVGLLRGWLGELPWLAASLTSLVVISARAHQEHLVPINGGWREYLSYAGLFLDPGGVSSLNPWRHPMWGLLVATWARVSGQAAWQAAFDFAHLSVVLIVLGAALTARALGGRTAAVFTALAAIGFHPLVQAWLWLDPYPAVGAATAVALALGAVAVRWGRPGALVAAGLAAGLGTAMDGRAAGTVLSVLGLAALVPLRPGIWRRVLLVATLLASVALAPAADRAIIHHWCIPQTPVLEQIINQNVKVGTKNAETVHPDLEAPGARLVAVGRLARRALSLSGFSLARLNLMTVSPGLLVVVPLWLLALAIRVPGGAWRRTDSAALVAFLPPLGVLLAACMLVGMFTRYTSSTWSLGLCLLPLAFARGLLRLLPAGLRQPRRRRAAVAVGTALFLGLSWPGLEALSHGPALTPHTVDTAPTFRSVVMLAERVAPGETVVDCSISPVGALVPWTARYTYDPGQPSGDAAWFRCRGDKVLDPKVRECAERLMACAAFAEQPPGEQREWLLAGSAGDPDSLAAEAALHAALLRGGWQQVELGERSSPEAWTRAGAPE